MIIAMLYSKQEHSRVKCNSLPSSTAKTVHYPHIALIPNLESRHDDLDHTTNSNICSLYNSGAILNISSKSAHIVLSNGRISEWAVIMVTQIDHNVY